MKVLKISLVVIVLSAIAVGIYQWSGKKPIGPGEDQPIEPIEQEIDSIGENQFIKKIKQEIDSIGKLPDNKFCKDFYKEVAYHIDDYHKENRLGQNQSENDQWKDILSIKLDTAYIAKFIRQTLDVFGGSEWKNEDLIFIHSECDSLRNSKWLETGSPADRKLTEIQTVISNYKEIDKFISSCKSFSYPGSDSDSDLDDRFPVDNVKGKILRAASYLNNCLKNEYLNNCTRLHDGLEEIPQALFQAHVRYLDEKIKKWSGWYIDYNSHSDYANNLYKRLRSEIEALDKKIYPVSNFDEKRENLLKKWSKDNEKAYNYFSQQIKEEIR
jgi:hypothetical protein